MPVVVGLVSTNGLNLEPVSGELYENDHENCIKPYGSDDVDLWDFLSGVQRRLLQRVRLLQWLGVLPRPTEVD